MLETYQAGCCVGLASSLDENMNTHSLLLTLLIPCALSAVAPAQSGSLAGPFVAGSGQWSTIPDGGFESGVFSHWWLLGAGLGAMAVDSQGAADGAYCARLTPVTSFSGNGFAAVHFGVPVTPSQQYVLSGFLRTDGMTDGRLRLDLNRVPWGISPEIPPGSPGWVFVWDTVTIPAGVTSVVVRAVRDGQTIAGEPGFVDEIALTPAGSFVPPTPSIPAAAVPFGVGCDGLELDSVGLPVVGSPGCTLVLSSVPVVSPFALFAIGTTVIDPGLDLGVIGMTGCLAYSAAEYGLQGPEPAVGGSATFGLAIPNSVFLVGVALSVQGLSLSNANGLGLATSNGLALTLGI